MAKDEFTDLKGFLQKIVSLVEGFFPESAYSIKIYRSLLKVFATALERASTYSN